MQLKLTFSTYLAIAFLAGCASNPRIDTLSSEERAKVSKIQIFKEVPDEKFLKLGEVSGLSCHRNGHKESEISESEALEGIKIKAVMLGGDAVINTLCQTNSDTDWANNCWSSIKCIGDAVKWQ